MKTKSSKPQAVPSASSIPAAAPVRIYVLWHPDAPDGPEIARQIYHWFRLENMEGIPVFFRSANASGTSLPPPIPDNCSLNYIVPLVEANMVADPAWRGYVAELAHRPDVALFPVALDPLAYQMPPTLRGLNFIRHDRTQSPSLPTDILLGQLTEVLCRDLRFQMLSEPTGAAPDPTSPTKVPGKIKLFLSHAKADGTEVPTRLKEYIQTHTQCETFFDETDIASGHDFEAVLENAIRTESAGMIAVHGDHYAERPWCRREIRQFQYPLKERCTTEHPGSAEAYFVPPLVVLQNMTGRRVARTIPELGYSPCLRWNEGSERLIVSTLLREILLGLFYRRLVHSYIHHKVHDSILVNRAPDPVLAQHLLTAYAKKSGKEELRILYPGYGLSQLEKAGLEATFPKVHFQPLSELNSATRSLEALAGQTLRLGIGNSTDILTGGLSDEHNKELLIRLLRPLCRHHVSILYGGSMPPVAGPLEASKEVNFTSVCLHLLLSERSAPGKHGPGCARLYNTPVWPNTDDIKPPIIAAWTDICSFHRVLYSDAGLPEPAKRLADFVPDSAGYAKPADQKADQARHERKANSILLERDLVKARCLTHMRRQACVGFDFTVADRVPGGPSSETIRPFAHLFLGGRLEKISGVAPGLFEEILYAMESGQPVFLIGAGYGATGAIARWLLDPPAQRPPELTPDHLLKDAAVRRIHDGILKMPRGAKGSGSPTTLIDVLDRLWNIVRDARGAKPLSGLLNNGLTDAENHTLFRPDTGYGEICRLVWKGMLACQEG